MLSVQSSLQANSLQDQNFVLILKLYNIDPQDSKLIIAFCFQFRSEQ